MPVLSWDQVAAVALKAGFPPGPAAIATAITMPESSRDSTIVQKGQPYATTGWGLWQITPGNSEPQFGIDERLLIPLNNGHAAVAKWRGDHGFGPWTTYVDGAYRAWLPQAEAAVEHVAKLPPKQLEQLVKDAGAGGAAPGLTVTAADDWAPRVRHTRWHVHVAARHFHGYAAGITRLQPRLTAPHPHPPSPGALLWTPKEGNPHAD